MTDRDRGRMAQQDLIDNLSKAEETLDFAAAAAIITGFRPNEIAKLHHDVLELFKEISTEDDSSAEDAST